MRPRLAGMNPLLQRRALLTLLLLFALPIGLFSLRYALPGQPGGAELPNLQLQRELLVLHAVSGALALMLGPWQFSVRLRARLPSLHRGIGWAYVICLMLGGLSALALAWQASGGIWAQAGFGLLGLLWLASTFVALQHARAGRYVAHRRWMLRSYALTAAGISLRLQLGLAMAAGVPFEGVYAAIAWSCWLPQALAMELWLQLNAGPAA